MAPAPQKKTKRRRRASHPVTKRELQENNPSVADAVTRRLNPYYKLAIVLGAIGTALVFGWQGYIGMGGKVLVSDRTLEEAIGGVKKEVNTKIIETKDEVVKNQNVIKSEITGSLAEVTKQLNSISKSQSVSAMDSAEQAQKIAFTQMQSLQGQLATVKQSLAKDPSDTMLQTRVLQLESFIKQNEKDMQDAKDKMVKLRSGQ